MSPGDHALAWALAGAAVGALVGGLFVWLYLHARMARLQAAKEVAESRLAAQEAAATQMGEKFQALADAALRSNQGAFLDVARSALETVRAQIAGDLTEKHTAMEGMLRPLAETLDRMASEVRDLERAREQMFGTLREQLQTLGRETAALASALRTPQVRGRWGELTLRRAAELAGMVERCDFVEQATYGAGDGRIRPDMIVHLPGGRTLVVDAKVPLAAYLEAIEAPDEARRNEALLRHSQQLGKHVEQLASKQYWSQFQPAPEMVVLFLPGDHFLSAALEKNPTLLEDAIEKKVLLATPTTLIAALKAAAFGWRQHQLAENAETIRRVAAEFYDRIVKWDAYYAEVARHLDRAVRAYNESVASWEARLLPALHRIRELGVAAREELQELHEVDTRPREPRRIESP
ncbi:MAG: DNA recombination protein RmuC [Bryobacterales bacterium]|nr:DNA recombination protein RmuC [Bryobacteraceae bacterium]MDW8353950.1 DNA recombination protein RmuC [Bryobacterales bacterium]